MVLRASAVMIMAYINRKRPNAIYISPISCCTCSSELTVVFIYCSADSPAVCGAGCYQVISGALEWKDTHINLFQEDSPRNCNCELSQRICNTAPVCSLFFIIILKMTVFAVQVLSNPTVDIQDSKRTHIEA